MDWRRRLRERRVRREERVRRVAPVKKMVSWLRERVVDRGCCSCGGFGVDIVGREGGWRNAMRRSEFQNRCCKSCIVAVVEGSRWEFSPTWANSTGRIIFQQVKLIPSTDFLTQSPPLGNLDQVPESGV